MVASRLKSLEDRNIDRQEAEKTLHAPDRVVPARPPREMLIRSYDDATLHQEMALCLLLEETETERIVITLYKTSQTKKYLEGTQR